MKDEKKTKAELIRELQELRSRVASSTSPSPERHDAAAGAVSREEMLEALFSSMDEGMVMVSSDGEILEANPAAARILNLTREEIRNRGYSRKQLKTFDADGNPLPLERSAVHRALSEKRPVRDVEIGVQRADGSMVWVKSSATPLLNDSGEIEGVVGTFVDITSRHEAIEALRQSEERFRAQFRGIPVPTYIWRKRDDDLVLSDCNLAAEEFTHGNVRDFIGMTAREIYLETPEILEELHHCLAKKTVIERTMLYRFKLTNERKRLAVKYVFVPPDSVMVHTEDITERAQAEEARRESEEKLQSILASMDDLVFVLDREGVFVSFHQPAHMNKLYSPPREFTGKTLEEVLPPHVASLARKALVDALATAEVQQFDYPLTIGGEELWFSAKMSLRKKNGNEFGGVTIVARDITQRKRALLELEEAHATLEQRVEERTRELVGLREQAEQVAAMRERERLARDLHDAVSQTLFSISLIADALPAVWARDPEEGEQRVQELRNMTRGALSEMRSLLVGMRTPTLVEGRLEELLHQLAGSIGGPSGLDIRVIVEGEGSVTDDLKVGLYRITQEALNNTVKHAEAGRAQVLLRHLPGSVELTVKDDGKGFELDAVPAGSMGLAIMRERAKALDARLTVDSRAGEGTRLMLECRKKTTADS